ncbi:MAG: helix-turn-helix domain-containing protein [Actinobacteria bacterium]|nr:helix-turn-helix domain-containing protein [Actinomycetota bacterium]
MDEYSPKALGQVVRRLRKDAHLTQEELGNRAGYHGGAGISISRIEHGQLDPSADRRDEIARKLGVNPEKLVALAVERTIALKGELSVDDRLAQIGQVNDVRKQLLAELEAFNRSHDRANTDFLMRFRNIASHLEGAPPPKAEQLEREHIPSGDSAESEAAYQIKFTRFGVATALSASAGSTKAGALLGDAADVAFEEAITLGAATLGGALPTFGAAALSAFRKTVGAKRPTAGGVGSAGTDFLLGLGMATLLAAVGGLLSMAQRSVKQRKELEAKLDEAEAEIAETQPSVDALRRILSEATVLLDYIAVHAAHALARWEGQIGEGQLEYQSLSAWELHGYDDFVEIAAAQIAVASLNIQDLLDARGDELEHERAVAGEVLTQARQVVTSRV